MKLHVALLIWVPACLIAGWWQATRAFDGNTLSYVYSVEWPIFALLGVWAWWVFVHTDPARAGMAGQRSAEAQAAAEAGVDTGPNRRAEEEDEELAAYNDHLAAMAQRGRKTWRNT